MATNIIQQTTGRAGQGRVSQRAKRFFMVGILGAAILLALAVGLAARQGADTRAVSEAPAAVAPSNPAFGVPFRLSAPNELDTDTTGTIPANSAPVVYQVSFPNESNPDGTISSPGYPPYNLSYPNEQHPETP
jgi:hypothetical protein